MKSLKHRFENFKSMPFAYRIVCPVCGARRLERCHPSIGRNMATPHLSRKKLAFKMKNEALTPPPENSP
jgi:hypothetical protein